MCLFTVYLCIIHSLYMFFFFLLKRPIVYISYQMLMKCIYIYRERGTIWIVLNIQYKNVHILSNNVLFYSFLPISGHIRISDWQAVGYVFAFVYTFYNIISSVCKNILNAANVDVLENQLSHTISFLKCIHENAKSRSGWRSAWHTVWYIWHIGNFYFIELRKDTWEQMGIDMIINIANTIDSRLSMVWNIEHLHCI